jgi:AcrR family transcriptional regulator
MSPRRAAVLRTNQGGQVATLREHLVTATDQLLEHRSIGELTTRAIAEHAGVSDGVLYNHFSDKHELLMVAMLRRYERLVERLEAAIPTAGEGSLVANVQAYGQALTEVESAVLLHGAGLLGHPPLLDRFWIEIHRVPFGIDRLRRPLTAYLSAEQRLGRVAMDVDVEAAVTVVFGVCAMSNHLNPTADRDALARHGDAALATAVNGLAGRH